MPETVNEALKELADVGGLCCECGGLCVRTMDTAIIASNIAENSGARIPWCNCPDCPTCKPLRETLLRVMKANTPLDTTPHCEDSL
jgi:hypothetical protein